MSKIIYLTFYFLFWSVVTMSECGEDELDNPGDRFFRKCKNCLCEEDAKKGPICASNGKTYPSECEFRCAVKCGNPGLKAVHKEGGSSLCDKVQQSNGKAGRSWDSPLMLNFMALIFAISTQHYDFG